MTERTDADVGFIHIAGGGARSTPPPGTRAEAAPRRAARGRSDDLLFVSLRLQGTPPPAGTLDQLARLGSEAYFDQPGSVTGALREAAAEVNQRILDSNQSETDPTRMQGHLLTGALRGSELIVAQSGFGQVILVRQGQVSRLGSNEASERPLGLTVAPHVRYHHLQVNAGDVILLTTASPPLWSDPALATLAGLPVEQAVERLGAAEGRDITGLLVRVVPQGQAASLPSPAAAPTPEPRGRAARPSAAGARSARRAAARARESKPSAAGNAVGAVLSRLSSLWEPVGARLQAAAESIGHAITRGLVRLAPGLAEAPRPGEFPPSLLAGTAVAVPLIVVAIASVVYVQRGRAEQFQTFLTEAQAAIQTARAEQDPVQARQLWGTALELLEQADRYGQADQVELLRQETLTSIDAIDIILRLDFRPVISGGFGAQAQISRLAATTTDLYLLDSAGGFLRRAWATGRGYELDETFECLGAAPAMGDPVDMAIQPEPGALGAEGVVAIDADGTLLYCAPEKTPATGELTEPDTGWGRVQAIDVFEGRLYVLDPERNAVWLYDASGGLFSGIPELYFAEEVPNLDSAIDLAATQDELFILHADGRLDRCRRVIEAVPGGGVRIRSECEPSVSFEDERPGFVATDHIPGALAIRLIYSPPPEPSLYFLDVVTGGVYHYSMRLVYQAQYRPQVPFTEPVSALAVGPPNELFVAVGDQVYFAQARR